MCISIQIENFQFLRYGLENMKFIFLSLYTVMVMDSSPPHPQPASSQQAHRCRRSVHIAQFEIERG